MSPLPFDTGENRLLAGYLDGPRDTTDYTLHLLSRRWWHMRRYLLAWNNWACQVCGAQLCRFHVHHIDYDRLGYERPCDLVLVCTACHRSAHTRDDDLRRYAASNPGSWAELRDMLGFEPRELPARIKLAALRGEVRVAAEYAPDFAGWPDDQLCSNGAQP